MHGGPAPNDADAGDVDAAEAESTRAAAAALALFALRDTKRREAETAMLANRSRHELWCLMACCSLEGGAVSKDFCLGASAEVMTLLVQSFQASEECMYDVFAVAVAYQLAQVGAASVAAESYVFTPQEVTAWQEPLGKNVVKDGEVQVDVAIAIVTAGKKELETGTRIKLREGDKVKDAVLSTNEKRLVQGVMRLVEVCYAAQKGVVGRASGGVSKDELAALMQGMTRCIADGFQTQKASDSKEKEEAVDEMKQTVVEGMLAEHLKKVYECGEGALQRQHEITTRMFVKLLQEVRDRKKFPDISRGDQQCKPNKMLPKHTVNFADTVHESEDKSLQVGHTGILKAKPTAPTLSFADTSQYAAAVHRFIMNIWFAACCLWDVPNKSAGVHQIGKRDSKLGSIQYAPRQVFEDYCAQVTQVAALMSHDLAQFDVIMVANLTKMAANHNETHGGSTLGLTLKEGSEGLEMMVTLGQMTRAVPMGQAAMLSNDGVLKGGAGGATMLAPPVTAAPGWVQRQASSLPGYQPQMVLPQPQLQPQVPMQQVQAQMQQQVPMPMPSTHYFQQYGFAPGTLPGMLMQKKPSRRVKKEKRAMAGMLMHAAAYTQNHQVMGQHLQNAQRHGGGFGQQQQHAVAPVTAPPVQLMAYGGQPGRAPDGKWIPMQGGNPYNTRMCNKRNPPCVKAGVCFMNHAQLP